MRGTIRQRLTYSVVGITFVMLVLLIVGFNLTLRASLDGDLNRALQARAETVAENVDLGTGRVESGDDEELEAEDALVWVFVGERVVKAPEDAEQLGGLSRSLAAGEPGRAEDAAGKVRFYVEPIERDGRRVGTVVAGISLEPYRRTAQQAAVGSVVLGLIMLVLVTLMTRLVVGRALKPVAVMTEEAAGWSENDLDRRFNEGEPRDELTRLAATFDVMLDRMTFMVRHERNFSAELSHELRTPLAAIAAESELALRRKRSDREYRQALERISARASDLTGILETLLDAARSESGAHAGNSVNLLEALESTLAGNGALAGSYGIDLSAGETEPGQGVQVAADTFGRILGPVIENAITYARSRVFIEAERTDVRTVAVTVVDDGPGFSELDLGLAFEPGKSGSANRNPAASEGTGLGLALARRLARANGGDVTVLPGQPGARVRILLPAAPET